MAKHKAGLHKAVSAIFDGVPLPGRERTDKPSRTDVPERPREQTAPKPQEERLQSPATVKPASPSHMTPTKRKPAQPVEPPAQPALPKVTKPETVKKPLKKVTGDRPWERITSKLLTPKAGVSTQRQKTMVILVPVLFIIMIFVFTRVFSTPSRVTAQPARSGPTGAVASSKDIDWEIPALYPAGLRDPMQIGSTTTEVKTSELVVRGIVYSEDNPSAVVGNEIVHEGEEVMGAMVVKINSDSVVFKMNDKEWTQKVER
ncbi:MAG: hypothetical protein JSV99_01040 [Planctomycetota bacterium]|nr:MAG: hypothetical protein JSV99_01040 [Planctomycetota bacterium]